MKSKLVNKLIEAKKDFPTHVFGGEHHPGYAINRDGSLAPGKKIDFSRKGDYGADPLGNGQFRMVPSGDIVDAAERDRRLK